MLRIADWLCRSGLVSRKGCAAAPAISALRLNSRGCCAALSRHKAAPTRARPQADAQNRAVLTVM
ncbi:hypothetical protein E5221_17560 [Pseudomonas sp. A2]|nr:hypothetical protein E5221_17560 [Pseudomonas sp. A2]